MKPDINQPTQELIEALAGIEHDQWTYWSQAVAEVVPDSTRARWQASWVDYASLPDEAKEADRVWARQVVALLRQRNLIP